MNIIPQRSAVALQMMETGALSLRARFFACCMKDDTPLRKLGATRYCEYKASSFDTIAIIMVVNAQVFRASQTFHHDLQP
jgi:hypothetical protein